MRDELDPRDGPSSWYRQHHDVTDRKSVGGKRNYPKVEQLLRGNYIQPEHCEAGRRFTIDYLKGKVGRGKSSLDFRTAGSDSDGHPSWDRLQASQRFDEASASLLEANGPRLPNGTPADLLVMVCVNDCAFSAVASSAGISDEAAKSWISSLLMILAGHYAKVDRLEGRSTTVYTREAALKRFEPELR